MAYNSYQGMVITTPPINSTTDQTTITMNNTIANSKITADFIDPKKTNRHSMASTVSTATNATSATSGTSSSVTASGDPSPGQQQEQGGPISELTQSRRPSVNGYVSRVGFDTLGCSDTSEYAFTLQAKTEGWKRTKTSRTFLVGTDLNDYSAHALQWVMDNMVEDGDEVVALRVVPMELRDSLSKTKIPSFQGQEDASRSEATKIMNSIRERNVSKKISIVVECLVGNVKDTIQHMIKLYKPDMLVVGTRGRSSVKGFLLGSVSRYCLHHSSVPVIVVRPERKLNKSKNKSKGIFRRRSSVAMEDLQNHQQLLQPDPQLQQQGMHMSVSETDLRRMMNQSPSANSFHSLNIHPTYQQQYNSSTNNSSNTVNTNNGNGGFISSTPPIGSEEAIGGTDSTLSPQGTPNQKTSPIIFYSPSNSATSSPMLSNTSSPAIGGSTSTLSFSPASSKKGTSDRPPAPMPPPPEGIIKMKKSLTTDGSNSSYYSSSSNRASFTKGFGKSSGGFLSGSLLLGPLKGKDKEKEKEKEKEGGASGSGKHKKRNSHAG